MNNIHILGITVTLVEKGSINHYSKSKLDKKSDLRKERESAGAGEAAA